MDTEQVLSHIDETLAHGRYAEDYTPGMPDAMRWSPDGAEEFDPVMGHGTGRPLGITPDIRAAIDLSPYIEDFTIVHVGFDPWTTVSHPAAAHCNRCPIPDEVMAEVRAMPPLSTLFANARRRLTARSDT